MHHAFSFVQILGYLGYLCGFYGVTRKDDNRLFFFCSLGSFFNAIHHLMLNNLTASAASLVVAIRMYLTQYYKGWVIAIPFVITTFIFGYLTYQNVYSLLPAAAVLAATIGTAYWKGILLRFILIGCCVLWLIHNFENHSYGGMANDITAIIMHSITALRIYRDEKKEKLTTLSSVKAIKAA